MGDLIAFPGCDVPVSTVETDEGEPDPAVLAALDNIGERLDDLITAPADEFDDYLLAFKQEVAELPDPSPPAAS